MSETMATWSLDEVGSVSTDALIELLRRKLHIASEVTEEISKLRVENKMLRDRLGRADHTVTYDPVIGKSPTNFGQSSANFEVIVPATPPPQEHPDKVEPSPPLDELPGMPCLPTDLAQEIAEEVADEIAAGRQKPEDEYHSALSQRSPVESSATTSTPSGILPSTPVRAAKPTGTFSSLVEKSTDTPSSRGSVGNLRKSFSSRNVFADADSMKEEIRRAVARPAYNVTNLYIQDSKWTRVATSEIFEFVTLAIICTNAVWIAVDSDHNDQPLLKDAQPVFIIMENLFCLYFSFELGVRFMSFKVKRDASRDAWFVFDSVLLAMMILETWVLTIVFSISNFSGEGFRNASILKLFRLIRLIRMARVARLLASMPELSILVKGIGIASRSVFWTLFLLSVIVFVFAVVFRQLTDGMTVGDAYFKSVPDAMANLFLYGAMPDIVDWVYDIAGAHLLLGFLLIFFVFLAALTVMNMLIGILCDVVSVVSAVEKEELRVMSVKKKLMAMLHNSGLDADEDMQISRAEFASLLTNPKAAKAIQEVGVDAVALVDYADIIFECPNKPVSFGAFIQLLLQFRGSNAATVKDVVDLHKIIKRETEKVMKLIQGPENSLGNRRSMPNMPMSNRTLPIPNSSSVSLKPSR